MSQNPDGAGFAIATDDSVMVHKGFFDAIELWEYLEQNYPEWRECNVVFHARIATSGKVNLENCHPYPVKAKLEDLTELDVECEMAMAHNGYIAWGLEEDLAKYSDTLLFVRDIMGPLYQELAPEDFGNAIECVAKGNSCRIATVDDESITLYGKGWKEDGGVYYSNTSYKQTVTLVNGGKVCAWCGDTLWEYEDVTGKSYWCDTCRTLQGVPKETGYTCPYCGGEAKEWSGELHCQECYQISGIPTEGEQGEPVELCAWCGFETTDYVKVNGTTICRDCWDSEGSEISHILGIKGVDCYV